MTASSVWIVFSQHTGFEKVFSQQIRFEKVFSQQIGFEKVFFQQIGLGAYVEDANDRAHTRRGQGKANGNLVILYHEDGYTVGIFERAYH